MFHLPSFVRNAIDSRLPVAGQIYRDLRDKRAASRSFPTPYGFSLAIPAISAAGTDGLAMTEGSYETEMVELFLQNLNKTQVCVDIGANIGFYSCLAASQRKHVISFEPLPSNLRYLFQNLNNNHFLDTEVFPLGLSSSPGLRRIYGSCGNASLLPEWKAQSETASVPILVPVTTLDITVGSRFEGVPLLVKMDVEGVELEVLKGAAQTLQLRPKPIWLVEIVAKRLSGVSNESFYRTFEVFWQQGYRSMVAESACRPVRPDDVARWATSGSVEFGGYNYLFVSD